MFWGNLAQADMGLLSDYFFQNLMNNICAMKNNFNEDYQYNSCTSRGICSINPRTSSLQEIVLMYMKQAAYYIIKLENTDYNNPEIKNLILNSISAMVSNTSFSETDFKMITQHFNTLLPELIKEYENFCKKENIPPKYLKTKLKFDKTTDITKSIRMGEQEFLKKINSVPSQIRYIYNLMFVVVKSICTNIQDLETFGENTDEGYKTIIDILNNLNTKNKDIDELKNILSKITSVNQKLIKKLREVQIAKYGKQKEQGVSHTTTPGKAILVVGSNIRELEIILDAVKNDDIDIYTHDEMMLAHTFPYFKQYKNLKGQFGKGIESCLLDFATFPGPIIVTRHSLYNIENLYRGRLFTTDPANTKGVIPIRGNNFDEVIKSAKEAKGFKTGKTCQTEMIGFDYEETLSIIKQKADSKKYNRIFIIGASGYTGEQQNYVKKLVEKTPKDVLIISLSYKIEKENVICLNACFDTYAISFIAEFLTNYKLPVTIFFPNCDRHTISKMIYFASKNIARIFVGSCTPILVNPNLITTLYELYGIDSFSTVKNDLNKILENC